MDYKFLVKIMSILGVFILSIGLFLLREENRFKINKIDYMENTTVLKEGVQFRKTDNIIDSMNVNVSKASLIREEVYEGLTLEEVIYKINKSIGSGYISNKGYLIATESLKRGVDPFVATAIIIHETGCGHGNCSALARNCNNFGGQKGGPSCNGGSYKRYESIDAGLIGMIDNLYRNYYSKGLVTIDSIGSRYAESNTWPQKIYYFTNKIKNS